MRFEFVKCHGSGNDFPLIDARGVALGDAQWAAVARALANRAGPVGGDGLLLLDTGAGGADFSMRMFNSDGSEAETCLNGLRCVARAGFEALRVEVAVTGLKTSSAKVSHEAALAPGVYTVRTTVGPASTEPADVGLTGPLAALPSTRAFAAIAMPNPHLVTFVDRVDEDELIALGRWCEAAPPLLPKRANVSFVEVRDSGDLFVRTFERGVGLTDSCGSAMAASVLAAALTGRVPFEQEVRVFNKGGLVRGRASADHIVTIAGNATFVYDGSVEVDLETGEASGLEIRQVRDEENAAWDAAVRAFC
jgi:diaminopimelate epimerase